MMRMCRRYTQDPDEAMTIINNGFLRVFKKLDTYSFKGSLEGWVRRLVFHSLSDFYRKGGASKQSVHFLELADWDGQTRNEALSNLYMEDLLQLADRLPPATRDVFFLFAVEGYGHKDIAHQLQISEGTSKWHLASARAKLKVLIQQHAKQYYAG
jgi:RNA polymerase sigma factor (sigma-70 family)